jgi:drug/metabolite transporter (DMT)-like permease
MDKRKEAREQLLSPGGAAANKLKMKTNINPMWLAIPASCDVCGSTLMFVALTMTSPSVYQMMRGLIVVITAFMSVIFLGRKQYRHHWVSIAFILTGVFIVGYVSVKADNSGDSEDGGQALLGIMLLIGSQCFVGCQFIVEEKILGDYYLEPFYIVGTEGMWGCAYYIILLPIFQLIKCPNQQDPQGMGKLCNYGYLENSAFGFWQMGQNGLIIFLIFLTICSIAGFNSTGIATTKYASAAQRSTIDTSRTLTIWIMSVSLGLEDFLPWEIPGFVLLVIGTLVYNEIVVVPYFGFDKYTKVALAKKKDADGRTSARQQYMATSPAAVYDGTRKERAIAAKMAEHQETANENDDFDIKEQLNDARVNNSTIDHSNGLL